MKVGMQINEYHTNLDGCGYIVARADTQEKAIKRQKMPLITLEIQFFKN